MNIKIDNKSSVAIYYQIYEQIKHQAAIGEIKIDEKIPTIRELAVKLRVNANTVAKAYTELQREDIIDTIQGVGTFIKGNKQVLKPREREDKLRELAEKFLDEALRFGFTREELIDFIAKYKIKNPMD
jgi:GntR family transcriptional regulator